MIYDDILGELEDMCSELGIDLPEVDLSVIRLCLRCGIPISGHDKKYCETCKFIAKREYNKKYSKKNRKKYYAAEKKAKEDGPKCECCGIYAIAPGFRKLCTLCYEYDGDGWIELYHRSSKEPRRE